MKWFELDPIRFELEIELLKQFHPGGKLIKENHRYRFELTIRSPKRTYELEASFPDKFPHSPVHVKIIKPKIKGSPPHYFSNGELCIYGSDNYGPETTGKVYVDWARQWIKCYEQWQKTKSWPATNGRKRNGE